jgi:UDP-N-acetylglucosamine 2-epimerase (non-hydrolysing)
MKILNVVGARPNLMKVAPLVTEMRQYPEIVPLIVHTGQHYDDNMSKVFFDELGIPSPDYNLGVGSGSHTTQTAQVMLALEPLFNELAPDLVLVVGDVNSTLAGAVTAVKMGIPLAHVEAGLRSFDLTMPEEINRRLTDCIADFLFTTEESANENLRREGVADDKVFFVGNVMIDTLLKQADRAKSLEVPARLGLEAGEYALLTLHRPSNVDNVEVLRGIVDALETIQTMLPLVFPAHPRTRRRLEEAGLLDRLRSFPDLMLVEPLGYLDFLGLVAAAGLVLTDSGGIQEETTILDVPCLTLRDNTERPVTIRQGTNQLVGSTPERIRTEARRLLDGDRKHATRPELWDGNAASRILKVLRKRLAQKDDSDFK